MNAFIPTVEDLEEPAFAFDRDAKVCIARRYPIEEFHSYGAILGCCECLHTNS